MKKAASGMKDAISSSLASEQKELLNHAVSLKIVK